MKTSSCKSKARDLQKEIAARILKLFPQLTSDDCRSVPMGSQGADVMLSAKAKSLWSYEPECKRQEGYKKLYDAYEQAKGHGKLEPIVFIRSNRMPTLAIVSADHIFWLLEQIKNKKE